jgi:hypothetical protein
MKLFDSDLTPTLHLVRHFDVLAFSVCFYHADDQSGLHHSLGIDAPSPPSPPFPRIYTDTDTDTDTHIHILQKAAAGSRYPLSGVANNLRWTCTRNGAVRLALIATPLHHDEYYFLALQRTRPSYIPSQATQVVSRPSIWVPVGPPF